MSATEQQLEVIKLEYKLNHAAPTATEWPWMRLSFELRGTMILTTSWDPPSLEALAQGEVEAAPHALLVYHALASMEGTDARTGKAPPTHQERENQTSLNDLLAQGW